MRSAIDVALRRPVASMTNASVSRVMVASGSADRGCDDGRPPAGDLADDMSADLTGDVDDHGSAFRRRGALADHDGDRAQQSIDGVLGRCATEMTGLADRAAHVLLVKPAVEHPDVQEVGHRARSGGCRHLLGEVRGIAVAQGGDAQRGQLVPLCQYVRACAAAASLDFGLVELTDGVLDVLSERDGRCCGRKTLQHPLGADQVSQIVLNGPPDEIGGQLPLALVEPGAQRRHRLPDLLELVDGVGRGHVARGRFTRGHGVLTVLDSRWSATDGR